MAVFFVLRRKSVEKRSMYSARRSQIEHKVRAARQRTLTPRGRSQKPSEDTIPGAMPAPPAQAHASSGQAWTPAPRPAEPVAPAEHVAAAVSATSAGGWSVVSTTKATAEPQPDGKKKGKATAAETGDWSLASGDAPGVEND